MKKFIFIAVFLFVAASALPASAEASVLSRPTNSLGLLGYWPMSESSGATTGDASGNLITASLTGSPSWVTGKFGKALSFGGTNYATAAVTWPSSGSISLWAYPTSYADWISPAGWKLLGASNGFILIDEGGSGSPGKWRAVFKPNVSGASEVDVVALSSITQNSWNHVVMTWSLVSTTYTVHLYVNGVDQGSATWTGTPGASGVGNFHFGNSGDYPDNYFLGRVDDVRVYNRALSSAEVAGLYQWSAVKIGMRLTSGLSGAYYDGTNFNTYVSTHTDSTINFNPADSLGVSYANSPDGDTFSVKWTGYVKADYTGTYTFYTVSDDGARLYVNNATVIDSWIDQGPTEHSGTIALVAGQWYPIELDFYENGGGAEITLSWSEASVSKQIIPATNLKPGTNDVKLNTSSAVLQGSSLASGLVGLWTFDGKDTVWTSSTAGTATDKSGNGNTGTLTNMTQAGSVVIGKMGQALSFDGSSTYVRVPDTASLETGTGAFSYCGWLYKTSALGVRGDFMNHKNVSGTFDLGFFIDTTNTIKIHKNPNTFLVGATSIQPNTWYQVCVTRTSGGSWVLYVNGTVDGTGSNTDTLTSTYDWWLGSNHDNTPTPSYTWSGKIDDVRLYNRALSAREVKQLYDMGK